jgi:hypothetical protein
MADCGCKKNTDSWEIVNGDLTVSPQTYATQQLAQAALAQAGGGGYVRQRQSVAAAR